MSINMGNELFMDNQNLEFSVRLNTVGVRQFQERSKIFTMNHFVVHPRIIARFTNRHISIVRRRVLRSKDGKGLCDQKRSGRPRNYTNETQLKTIAFYCRIFPLPWCGKSTSPVLWGGIETPHVDYWCLRLGVILCLFSKTKFTSSDLANYKIFFCLNIL